MENHYVQPCQIFHQLTLAMEEIGMIVRVVNSVYCPTVLGLRLIRVEIDILIIIICVENQQGTTYALVDGVIGGCVRA